MTREQERKQAAIEKILGSLLTEAQLRENLPGSGQNWFNHRDKLRETAGVQFRDLWFYFPEGVEKVLAVIEENRKRRAPRAKAPVPVVTARKTRGRVARVNS